MQFTLKHHLYILCSVTRDRCYIGSCSDVEERLRLHNAGATPSTLSGRPWKVVHCEEHLTKAEALKRENYIKRMK